MYPLPNFENKMILHGDCLNEMRAMEDNSVDSIVTDPPYGISFMGKKWDYDIPQVEVWKEAMRVLKAGGHILVACGTRTQHRMCVNIEDAGFEIRDIVAWVYGSGFPKSLNIGKAVDKMQGNEREVNGVGKAGKGFNKIKGFGVNTTKGGEATTEWETTKGTSEWEGWGTALKPAMELWTLARKPLAEKTVAENVLKYGTGGINIDGSRVGTEVRENQQKDTTAWHGNNWSGKPQRNNGETKTVEGRFPANLIHDGSDEVRECFPETKTNSIGKALEKGVIEKKQKQTNVYGAYESHIFTNDFNDSGNASRFFKSIIYTAKASKSERGKGNHHPTVKPIKLMQYLTRLITPKGGIVLDPYMGSGTTGIACKKEGFEFIGIELDKDYFEIAKARIEKLKFQRELF